MNKPVAWMLNGILHECDPSDWAKEQYPDQDVIPLYTHPHPDNLGLALSIIDQQKLEIEMLRKELSKYPRQGQSIPCAYTEGIA